MTNTKQTLTSTCAAFCFSIAGAFSPAVAGEHDNKVMLHTNGLTACSFSVTDYSITSGQGYSGVTASGSNGVCTITVKAGRKGSSSVASWFKTKVANGNAVACDSKGPMPDKLNFAVQGTLVLDRNGSKATCDAIILAQGHFATVNNWWLGGPDMKSGGVPFIGPIAQVCKTLKPVVFTPQQPCVNNFNAVVE